jgi:hypothetical protein
LTVAMAGMRRRRVGGRSSGKEEERFEEHV